MTSLEELAKRAADGDRDAFGGIYEALLDPVYRYLYWSVGSREEAEDLAEETFLKCLVNIDRFNPKRGPFKAWAFRIAHNVMVDRHRRRSRRGEGELTEDLENGAAPSSETLEEKERAGALRGALAELPEMQRQVIVMKYFAEMSNADAAAALGRSEGAINALQHRALRRLGRMLDEAGWRE